MQTKKIVVASIFFFLMITLGLVFRPLPSSSSENTGVFTGTIEQVVETGNKNVVFKLKNDDRFYFIEEGAWKRTFFSGVTARTFGQIGANSLCKTLDAH